MLYLSCETRERDVNTEHVSFIDYKGTADWLLAHILKRIAYRLILCPHHRSIKRNFSNTFKNMKAAYRKQKLPQDFLHLVET